MIPRDEGSPAFGSRRVLALAVLCSAWLMIVLDFFIVNVALPAMQEDPASCVASVGIGLAFTSSMSAATSGREEADQARPRGW